MKYTKFSCLLFLFAFILSCQSKNTPLTIPAEFEEQEYIWLSWKEKGFFGGEPFNTTIIQVIKEMHPYVKLKLFYGPEDSVNGEQMAARIRGRLTAEGIPEKAVELFYNEISFGAIQDPGPVFLQNEEGKLAIADFRYRHPDPRAEKIDRNVASQMGIETISSAMFSDGGGWQTNGKGTLLLVESVESEKNPEMSKVEIENEYKRVLGVKQIIWLRNGMKEEEFRKFENGKFGIGTNGHIDEFCRFVNDSTVLLAEVSPEDTVGNAISAESYRRLELSYNILKENKIFDGKSINIIRLPAGPLITKRLDYKSLNAEEKTWLENVVTDSVEIYLATGYMNFVIANGIVVTAKFWKEGLPENFREKDQLAKHVLEKAFPNRKIVQIDCMPLHHDGAGLHCHTRNQPQTKAAGKEQ